MTLLRSARARLALSYALIVIVAGVILLALVWLFLLRYVPDDAIPMRSGFVPNRSDLGRAFWPRAAWAFAFLVAFGLIGGWFLAGRMLSPLQRITAATRATAAGSLSHRIRMTGRDDEFGELADAFDSMLARIESHVAEQRRFAANASHELRTPLSVMRSVLDVARDDPDADPRVALERLAATNDRAIAVAEALLALASAERGIDKREPIDLSLAAEAAAEELLPLAERNDVTLDLSGDRADVRGDPALLGQLATNLLHNAIVHNTAGGWARVATSSTHGEVTLVVENTGEVLDDATVSTLAEPFQRGSERTRRDDHSGTGLGLAIARAIVDGHDGTLTLRARTAGGMRVEVRLPAADQRPTSAPEDQRGGRW